MSEEHAFPFLVSATEPVGAPGTADGFGEGAGELERHVRVPFMRRAEEASITSEQLQSFWEQHVVGLTNTIDAANAEKQTKGFSVTEISFGIAIGAKGGLLFVAEASLEASLTVKLTRT